MQLACVDHTEAMVCAATEGHESGVLRWLGAMLMSVTQVTTEAHADVCGLLLEAMLMSKDKGELALPLPGSPMVAQGRQKSLLS